MSTRDRILDGAAVVMRERGLAHATTKEIARAAGLSEAMLYKVFRDKTELFLGVLTERLPRVAVISDGFLGHVGAATVRAGLRRLTAEILAFYLEAFPIAASVFSDAGLLARHREELRQRGAGPQIVVETVTAYLAAEQELGRLGPDAKPRVLAELLVGACLHRAFLTRFAGDTTTPEQLDRFAADVVDTLAPALHAPGSL